MPKKNTEATMDPVDLTTEGSNSAESLLSGIERVESLMDEEAEVKVRIKEEKAQLKGMGFDPKVVNAILKRRKEDANAREEHEALVETYEQAIESAKARRQF